jgi:hypothetical protein
MATPDFHPELNGIAKRLSRANSFNKALVPTAGAALSAMLSVTLTRHPVSERHPAPAVGTA